MRWFPLVLLGLLGPALAATTLGGDPPWSAEHVVLGSTTDWDIATAPTWARQCIVKNEHASGNLALGRYDETGTYVALTDEYVVIAAGAAITVPLSAGGSQADAVHLKMPLFSSTASLPVGIYCTASPE
jgi:hypothetical protein